MTPLMRQYWDIKASHQDKILLFRMGDFYEMFFDDAKMAAPILGIALTQRNKKSEEETPMCGVPHHSIAGPINKLLKQGLKVAICDQIEDPAMAKGIVKRAVTRVLTPGMVYDPDTLEHNRSNYIACIQEDVLAFAETSTGECFYFEEVSPTDLQRLLDLLPVAELLLAKNSGDNSPKQSPDQTVDSSQGNNVNQLSFQGLKTDVSAEQNAIESLKKYIYGLGGEESLARLKNFERRSLQQRMDLSNTVVRHLELFETYKGDGQGSLFFAIDRSKTSGGARLLRQWLLFPLTDEKEIRNRQDNIEKWHSHPSILKLLRESLGQMGDLERRFSRLTQPQCNARDLISLSNSIQAGLQVLSIAKNYWQGLDEEDTQELSRLAQQIEATLSEEAPLTVKQGHIIKRGVHPLLDEYIDLSTNSQTKLLEMEQKERELTGISSLKIRYNNVFGYYIEITNTHADKVPARYQRKQTLVNAERFCTPELIDLEKKVLAAQSKRADLEFEIFEDLRKKTFEARNSIYHLAKLCAELDVIAGLSWLALERRYVKPNFNKHRDLKIEASRHPVVEMTVKKQFIANEIQVSAQGCLLLTGPNMAGKSTLMRQVALTAIMAQMGSFVAASRAELPIFDHLFTRIGASDQLSEGLSTFMVEMTETAEMLKKSSKKSLLILDEIGRGTSTFDGMSLAQSILEYILQDLKAMTLFATHYHELTTLEQTFPQLKNAHMSVLEKNGEIKFLHSLKSGPAQKSYGIQVAKIAGLPESITQRAAELLKKIETAQNRKETGQLSLLDFKEDVGGKNQLPDAVEQMLPTSTELLNLIRDLKDFPLYSESPLKAMQQIEKWKTILETVPERQFLS